MREGSAKTNLLIDSLSSDSDNGIPDLELVPPSRAKKKQRFKKMASKLNLPKVTVNSEKVLPRVYTWCLSLLLCSLVVGLGVTSWFSVSLHRSMQDYMRNSTATIASLQHRVKMLESSQELKIIPPVPEAAVPDNTKQNELVEFKRTVSQLQGNVSGVLQQISVLRTETLQKLQSSYDQLKENLSVVERKEKTLVSRIDYISDQLSTTLIGSIQFILDCLNQTGGNESCVAGSSRLHPIVTNLSSLSDNLKTTSVATSSTENFATTQFRRRTIETPSTRLPTRP